MQSNFYELEYVAKKRVTRAGTTDALYDSQAIRRFVGIDLNREVAPDATPLLKFRHLLEAASINRIHL
jgi:IS5 family transposase